MKKLNIKNFYFELISNTSLIITIPEEFDLIELIDMKIKDKYFYFKFNEKKSKDLNLDNIAKININKNIQSFINEYLENPLDKEIFIIDIKELKRQTEGIFYIYEK